MAKVIASTSEFDKILVEAGEKLVTIDFTASWCPPCKMIAPHFDALARKYEDKAYFLKVDVDQHQAIAQRYGVRAMPTFAFVRKGGVIDTLRGANVAKLTQLVQQYIEKGSAASAGSFPGSGNSLSGRGQSVGGGAGGGGGGIFSQIPKENLMPFAIVAAYLIYIVYSKS